MLKNTLLIGLIVLLPSCTFLTSEEDDTNNTETDIETPRPDGNDSLSEAQDVSIGDTITVEFALKGDQDYYKFTLTESALLNFQCSDFPFIEDFMYGSQFESSILDDEGVQLYKLTNTSEFTLYYNLPVGTYYLQLGVSRYGFSKSNGTLILNRDAVDILEYNDQISNAAQILFDTTYGGKILPKKDHDFFTFTVAENLIATISIDSISSQMGMALHLYDEDSTRIERFAINDSTRYSRAYEAGIYFLELFDNNDDQYSDKPFYFSISEYTEDTCEWNNSTGSAYKIDLNSTYSGTIFPSGDEDYYRFTVTDLDTFTFFADNISSKLDGFEMRVLDSEGTRIERINNYPFNDTLTSSLELTQGDYYVQVFNNSYGELASDKQYNLSILH